jgi:hypothetical protein
MIGYAQQNPGASSTLTGLLAPLDAAPQDFST